MLAADVFALYGHDPVALAWRLPLPIVHAVLERTSLDPNSRWRAQRLGDDAWYGWTPEVAMTANVVDAVREHAYVVTHPKKRFPDNMRWPRPTTPKPEMSGLREVRCERVADMDWGAVLTALVPAS